MIISLARATGWSEEKLMTMPLKRALQYLHAAWNYEGIKCYWAHYIPSAKGCIQDAMDMWNKSKIELLD